MILMLAWAGWLMSSAMADEKLLAILKVYRLATGHSAVSTRLARHVPDQRRQRWRPAHTMVED